MNRLVLFDLDDTLCDYSAARQRGLASALEAAGIPVPERDRFASRYLEAERERFGLFTDGAITIEEYRQRRFGDVLTEFGFSPDLERRMNTVYMAIANDEVEPFADTRPALEQLKERDYELGIFTNGPRDGQLSKLVRLGLESCFDSVFISETLGFAKPDPRAFQQVLTRLGRLPAEICMVGDSLTDDILPAVAQGMNAILLDRRHAHDTHEGSVPRVESLVDLADVVDRL